MIKVWQSSEGVLIIKDDITLQLDNEEIASLLSELQSRPARYKYNRLTKEEKDEALRLFNEVGISGPAIAERLGISKSGIYNVLGLSKQSKLRRVK